MPEYADCLVAFYDILGFSDFVRSHPDADDVHKLFAYITDVASVSEESTEVFGQRFIHFSDTVIHTTPFTRSDGKDNRFGMLFYELQHAVHFQMELIWKELVWLRGSITYGQAFHGPSEVYGPAIIRAYELERDVAIFPRVVIDPQLLTLFEQSSNLHSGDHDLITEREYCFNFLRCGDDGIWFIDYLRAAKQEVEKPEDYPIYLTRHKSMILRRLSKQTSLQRLTQKYTWLTHYHNRTVRCISDEDCVALGITKDDLLISSTEAALYYTHRNDAI